MNPKRPLCRRLMLAAALLLGAVAAQAQDWPARPVKVIVPFPPGGGTDTVARPLTAKLTQLTGQQFVIDNRGGAGGTIGAAAAAKRRPTATPCCCRRCTWRWRCRPTRACPTTWRRTWCR